MNNEKMNQIIDDAYKNYRLKSNDIDLPENLYNNLIDDLNKDVMFPIDNPSRMLSKEKFINKIKTDSEFSKKWGLKIEEREVLAQIDQTNPILKGSTALYPHKLITITYNGTKIESYE